MKKINSILVILSILFVGCAHNVSFNISNEKEHFIKSVNRLCQDKDEIIIYTDYHTTIKANNLMVSNDSTSFYDFERDSENRISTSAITRLEFSGTSTGIFEGILFGSLIGGGAANIFSNTATNTREGKAIYLMFGIVGGAIAGVLYNIFCPSFTTIIFEK